MTLIITYVVIVAKAKTTAMVASNASPLVEAAKNAGMPSIIGDDPRMSNKAVRPARACS